MVEQYNSEFNTDKITELEKRIKKIVRDINKAVEAMLETSSKTARERLSEKVEELEAQKNDLEIDLAKLKVACGIRYTEEDIRAWIKQFCKGDPMDEDFRHRIIDVFINSVYLYDDHVIITYNVKGGKQISYIEAQEAAEKLLADEILADPQCSCDIGHGPPKSIRLLSEKAKGVIVYKKKQSGTKANSVLAPDFIIRRKMHIS